MKKLLFVFSFSLLVFPALGWSALGGGFAVFAQYSIPGLDQFQNLLPSGSALPGNSPSLPGPDLNQFSELLKQANKLDFGVRKFLPLAGEKIQFNIKKSGRFDPKLAEIFWYVDGNLKSAGLGQDSFSFIVGEWGKAQEIKVIAKTSSNSILQNSYNFIVGDLNLSWRADTAAPEGYRGLSLATPGSLVTVSAQPMLPISVTDKKVTKIKQENPAKLFYRWFLNDEIQSAFSGVGKSEFSFPVSFTAGAEYIVAVEAENIKNNQTLRQFVKIKVVSPNVVIFPSGDTLTFKKGETVNLLANPYFFTAASLADLNFVWSINGQNIEGESSSNPNRLALVIPAQGQFSFKQLLSLFVDSKNNVFQRFTKNINIKIE